MYFSAGDNEDDYQPRAVDFAGHTAAHAVLPSVGRVIIQDVGRDDRWLVTREDQQASIRALVPGATDEREFPWRNGAIIPSLSSNGELLVFTDISREAGPRYAVVMRRTDGSPAVRLGEGFGGGLNGAGFAGGGLSPDARWALGVVASPPQVVAYPTGSGDSIRLDQTRSRLDRALLVCHVVPGQQAGRELRERTRASAPLLCAGHPWRRAQTTHA